MEGSESRCLPADRHSTTESQFAKQKERPVPPETPHPRDPCPAERRGCRRRLHPPGRAEVGMGTDYLQAAWPSTCQASLKMALGDRVSLPRTPEGKLMRDTVGDGSCAEQPGASEARIGLVWASVAGAAEITLVGDDGAPTATRILWRDVGPGIRIPERIRAPDLRLGRPRTETSNTYSDKDLGQQPSLAAAHVLARSAENSLADVLAQGHDSSHPGGPLALLRPCLAGGSLPMDAPKPSPWLRPPRSRSLAGY